MFWRRSSAIRAALLLTLSLALMAPGGAPAMAQTLGDVVGAVRRAQSPPPSPSPEQPAGNSQAFATATDQTGRPVGNALFGTTEIMSRSLKGLPQWTRVLAEMEREHAVFEACAANAKRCTTPTLRNWNRLIASAARLERAEKIRKVNEFFNRWPYKEDNEIYGRSEYWASPNEFMARSGDCEDYSIAKYFALRALGFDKNEMRIVILMDEIRGIGHAVLALYEGDGILILDSLSNLILPDDRYKHYRPQYSMNESTRWAHIGGYDRNPTTPYTGLVARRNSFGVGQ